MVRILLAVAAIVVLAVAAAGGVAAWLLHAAKPTIEGRMPAKGLGAPVDVVRDAHGVPHIFAQDRADALYALGFVHAQDRFWRMHVFRRAAAGRLSEMFGAATVETDIFLRTIDLMGAAESAYAALPEDGKKALGAYAAGVNAALDLGEAEAIEFTLLGLAAPEAWRPEDSVAAMKMMALDLAVDAGSEVTRLRLMRLLGVEKAGEYMPPYPEDGPIALSAADLGTDPALHAPARPPVGPGARPKAGPSGLDGAENGSNNWVIGGRLTTTGKPLLANDPHLSLSAPSLWYLAHLSFDGRDAYGATIPGVPGVVLGRTRNVAWGFTNNGADVQDLYRERVDPADPTRYLTPDGSAPFRYREETIRVKGGEDVDIVVRSTRHGPVMPEGHAWADAVERDADEVAALAWTALAPTDTSALAAFALLEADGADDFVKAARFLQDPIQSIVFADASGVHGFMSPARVPVRGPDHETQGYLPARGWVAENDWIRIADPDETPLVLGPVRGYVATANQMIVPRDFPIHHSFDRAWRRAARIEERLGAEAPFDLDDMADIQRDTLSHAARALTPAMIARTRPESERARAALDILRAWDFRMEKDLVAPTIFVAWTDLFQTRISEDDLGPLFRRMHRPRPDFLENVLLNGADAWCDDLSSAPIETCEDALRAGLEAALDRLEAAYGADMEEWAWGAAHPAVHAHAPFEEVGGLKDAFSIRTPSNGGYLTVNRGYFGYDGDALYENVHAGGLRALYDLSRPEGARFMIATGQSGHVASEHYRDLAPLWAEGGYIELPIDRAAVEAGETATLSLDPAMR